MIKRLLTVCWLATSVSACALLPDHIAYEGEVPEDQLVQFRVYDAGNFQNPGPHAADIVSINNKKFNLLDHSTHSNVFLAAPGTVTINFRCTDHRHPLEDNIRANKTRPGTATFEVKPGEKYDLGCRQYRRRDGYTITAHELVVKQTD